MSKENKDFWSLHELDNIASGVLLGRHQSRQRNGENHKVVLYEPSKHKKAFAKCVRAALKAEPFYVEKFTAAFGHKVTGHQLGS
jgi:hypothetical protein